MDGGARAGFFGCRIAERYPRLAEDKVSNMLIAARMREAYPMLFDILIEPDPAFNALQVERVDQTGPLASKLAKPKLITPLESEPILGHDDLPVA